VNSAQAEKLNRENGYYANMSPQQRQKMMELERIGVPGVVYSQLAGISDYDSFINALKAVAPLIGGAAATMGGKALFDIFVGKMRHPTIPKGPEEPKRRKKR